MERTHPFLYQDFYLFLPLYARRTKWRVRFNIRIASVSLAVSVFHYETKSWRESISAHDNHARVRGVRVCECARALETNLFLSIFIYGLHRTPRLM